MNSGDFYAEGSPKFVAAATLGNAIGTAVNRQETFDDCMMAVGYTQRGSTPAGSPVVGLYGAFALDEAVGKYGFSWNEGTQRQAEDAAIKSCNTTGCKVVFRAGPKQCGAIALTDDGKVWGGATRPARDAAQAAAVVNCQRRTQSECKLRAAECNS
jgi:hypothetical protein